MPEIFAMELHGDAIRSEQFLNYFFMDSVSMAPGDGDSIFYQKYLDFYYDDTRMYIIVRVALKPNFINLLL